MLIGKRITSAHTHTPCSYLQGKKHENESPEARSTRLRKNAHSYVYHKKRKEAEDDGMDEAHSKFSIFKSYRSVV